jgi:diaminohydroxyphosphoribosylaminopyrimidine deaminase/5-amino-6-(5-phosphoribosylamino)uracil reductase
MNWSAPMLVALKAARRGYGNTGPNPLVGAVLVRDGELLATGYHRQVGAAHAEVEVLDQVGDAASGADLVVTLEPCSHYGRTPPCVERIIDAGVARVVVGTLDPNPRERGRGVTLLREAGVEVILGVEEEACRRANEPYFKYITTSRPFVTLKLALSLDGCIATSTGDSNWFTGPQTNRFTHALRRDCNAIMVGGRTAVQDDPSLTVRDARPRTRPLRVVLSPALDLPDSLRLLADQKTHPTVVFTAQTAPLDRVQRLTSRGVEVVRVPEVDGGLSLAAVMERLGRRGVARLLVDGGGRLAGALVSQMLVDRLILAYAPLVVGEGGRPGFALPGVGVLADARRYTLEWSRRSGADVLASWRLGPEYWRGVP